MELPLKIRSACLNKMPKRHENCSLTGTVTVTYLLDTTSSQLRARCSRILNNYRHCISASHYFTALYRKQESPYRTTFPLTF